MWCNFLPSHHLPAYFVSNATGVYNRGHYRAVYRLLVAVWIVLGLAWCSIYVSAFQQHYTFVAASLQAFCQRNKQPSPPSLDDKSAAVATPADNETSKKPPSSKEDKVACDLQTDADQTVDDDVILSVDNFTVYHKLR